MYNKVTLVGRIANNLELKQTSNAVSYCKFNIAVNKNFKNDSCEYETDFIPVTVWKKSAENLVQFQQKGSLILVDGSISMSNYTDKDGNNRVAFEVMAQNVQFLGSKKESSVADNNTAQKDQFAEFGDTVTFDDGFLD